MDGVLFSGLLPADESDGEDQQPEIGFYLPPLNIEFITIQKLNNLPKIHVKNTRPQVFNASSYLFEFC